jgi:predicted HicB family RNase H-like nuclease
VIREKDLLGRHQGGCGQHQITPTVEGDEMTTAKIEEEVRRLAETAYRESPDWVSFYREVLGLRGLVRRSFPTREALAQFEQTEAYQEIQHKLAKLRERGPLPTDPEEPTRVITVRMPKSMHEALRVEAHEHHTSMNKLCISKLLQFIDNEMIPAET